MSEQREPIKVLGTIIASEMDLRASGPNCQIMLTNERFNIPINDDIYVALSYIDGKAIGNNNYFDGNAAFEIQQVVMLYHIQIDIMSYGPEARRRKEEVFMALRSIFAQQQMEIQEMQIARMPAGFADASSLEATKMLNRFTMSVAVTAMFTKEKAVANTYDAFPFQFDENDGGRSPILTPEEPFND